ncbi:MAG: hypothetical protein KDK65_00190 [Chlamydiia bacterium]|nr:hypothetical protein [Chlamydiia bacterium]
MNFLDGDVQIFQAGSDSQGLINDQGTVAAASVSTSIKTTTARKDETKGTYIQYDKDRVNTKRRDFSVSSVNPKGVVNYDGGHLIDHQFSAGKSHRTKENYVPQIERYNKPYKPHLVRKKRCDAFIEIPLYTPNPPTIGVIGKPKVADKIPVGIIFVQIKDKKIVNVYYFPNNNIDYYRVEKRLGLTKSNLKKLDCWLSDSDDDE